MASLGDSIEPATGAKHMTLDPRLCPHALQSRAN
jgi:hypothetical protein